MERYEYDSSGCIRAIINADGVAFVHNEYDGKGRVTRQLLSDGQEYILLYDDTSRTNTLLTPQNGKEVRYGLAVTRESVAIADIMDSPDYHGAPIVFIPYNSSQGPIIYMP